MRYNLDSLFPMAGKAKSKRERESTGSEMDIYGKVFLRNQAFTFVC